MTSAPNASIRTLLTGLCVLGLLAGSPTLADDPFLEPQKLPPELGQLNLSDSTSGKDFLIRLDENKLPIRDDFFGEQADIPFTIEGALLESPSGSRLHAWTVIPKQDANGIAVLLLHGNGGNILSNLGAGIGLMKRGFRVTIVDYSGYGYSTGEATRDNVLLDAEAALAMYSAAARAAGEPLVLYGMSLGGHLAVVVAANHPEAVDALVIEGAFSSHRDMAAHRRGTLARVAVAEPYSAEKRMGEVQAPLLVIHSIEDAVVPFAMGQELFDLAREPKQLLEIDGPHLAGLAAHGDDIAAAILALLRED